MDDRKDGVSYFILEGIMTHFSTIIKRLSILIIIIAFLWVATIAGFLWYISLPIEDISNVSVENDTGNANYIGNDMNGDFNYGEGE